MPTPNSLKAIFSPENFYHIVCKSTDGLLLFHDNTDCQVFKQRLKKFTGDILDVWSFCLIPNHTHHIVKTKSIEAVVKFVSSMPTENMTIAMKAFVAEPSNESHFNKVIERQMNSFLVSYANYINNRYQRKGSIFQKPFKRIKIEDEAHLHQAIIYTNANAQKHDLIANYKEYSFSSYKSVLENDEYFINAKDIIAFFKGLEKFVLLHDEQVAYFYQRNWPNSKLE